MSKRIPVVVCSLSVVMGLVVAVTLGLPALADGREIIGLAVLVCAIFGVSFGVTGLVFLFRERGRPRTRRSSSR